MAEDKPAEKKKAGRPPKSADTKKAEKKEPREGARKSSRQAASEKPSYTEEKDEKPEKAPKKNAKRKSVSADEGEGVEEEKEETKKPAVKKGKAARYVILPFRLVNLRVMQSVAWNIWSIQLADTRNSGKAKK